MRGATDKIVFNKSITRFQLTRPMRGATIDVIAEHVEQEDFNSRAPCGARLLHFLLPPYIVIFQLTRPMRGATNARHERYNHERISTHAPHAGRDVSALLSLAESTNFNSRAPCGARQPLNTRLLELKTFQLTRPMRGATLLRHIRDP